MQTIYPVFLQFMYNIHEIIYIHGTCNLLCMPTFHRLYKLPFENFVMWRSCPVLIDVGWPGKYFVVPGAIFVFAKMLNSWAEIFWRCHLLLREIGFLLPPPPSSGTKTSTFRSGKGKQYRALSHQNLN